MVFYLVFDINKNIVQVYNNKNIELFCQDLIDIFLKSAWCVGQFKKHNLIFEMAILGPKGCFRLVFFNLHFIISIGKAKLDLAGLIKL